MPVHSKTIKFNIFDPSDKVSHRVLESRNAAPSSLKSVCLLSPLDKWAINISALPRCNLTHGTSRAHQTRGSCNVRTFSKQACLPAYVSPRATWICVALNGTRDASFHLRASREPPLWRCLMFKVPVGIFHQFSLYFSHITAEARRAECDRN